MRSDFEDLKRFAIADILSVSGKQKTTETINTHINTIIDIAFLKGQQTQQSKVDELQNRIDEALEDLEYPTAPWDETISSVIKVLRGSHD